MADAEKDEQRPPCKWCPRTMGRLWGTSWVLVCVNCDGGKALAEVRMGKAA